MRKVRPMSFYCPLMRAVLWSPLGEPRGRALQGSPVEEPYGGASWESPMGELDAKLYGGALWESPMGFWCFSLPPRAKGKLQAI